MARRHTSDEEHALFRSALKDAKPLKTRPRAVTAPHPRSGPRPHPPAVAPVYLEKPAPSIGGHRDAQLRRGRAEPEGRIDLHGMTHNGAYRALLYFLQSAQADDKRLVLVVTGKGSVLRSSLPLWLGQPELESLVAGVAEAHIKHGGAGAFYVSLRRLRRHRSGR